MSLRWWHDLSVSKKLYTVVGIMALLIATELFTLFFAMNTLSAVRGFVAGEALWSKAQKNAFYYLQRYAATQDERFYRLFEEQMKVPMGDRYARLHLMKPVVDMSEVTKGFLQGQNHPDDIPRMVDLVLRFHQVPLLAKAIAIWTQGDQVIEDFISLASSLHTEIEKVGSDPKQIDVILQRIAEVDTDLTRLEKDFSNTLGEASRWLENLLMVLLLVLVITVESTGLFLTFRFARGLTRILGELNFAAVKVGQGDFEQEVPVRSQDELGQLAQALNSMTSNLKRQIKDREHAEHASQAKNLFLANMSHEIRTPLNAILGFSELLQEPHLNDMDRKRYGDIIKRTGESLTTIINDILDVSRVEAEQIKLDLTHFSLSQLLSDIYVLLKMRCEEKGIQLHFVKKGEVAAYILSDQTRLRQILVNMIGNSIKFTEKGGVTLEYQAQDNQLMFIIKDTGAGMAPAQLHNLFKPFSQGDSSVRKKYGGTGLGLVISKRLAQLLGGDVGLIETSFEGGTSFYAKVKYNPSESSRVTKVDKPADLQVLDESALKGLKILVVEDSIDNQILVESYLRRCSVEIEFASNGEEGLNKAKYRPFDFILMDMQMPVMDGYTATQEMRKLGIQVPIIALTGYAMKEDRDKCIRAGCDDFITKPFNRRQLIQVLLSFKGKTSLQPPLT